MNPHDVLAWVELAHAQLACGHTEHALESMLVARQLAPDNRYVLRCSARLFLHVRDPERAHDLIRKNDATPHDVWLMAAEFGLAPLVDKDPVFFKKGMAALESDRYLPRQISELAGAAATLCYLGGNRKKGKRLFRQSLIDPTGNSLAQAEYTSQAYKEALFAEVSLRLVDDRKEAMARHSFGAGVLPDALSWSLEWIREEPFSNNAYRLAAASANLLDDYGKANELAISGLERDPRSIDLQLSRIFSLASLNELEDAERLLNSLKIEDEADARRFIAEADRGMIAIRRGQLELGELHYRIAITGFRKLQNPSLARSAQTYLAREAARVRHPSAAKLIMEAAGKPDEPILPNLARVLASARAIYDANSALPSYDEKSGNLQNGPKRIRQC